MKFKNLNKMRVLDQKELSKVKGADCSSCSAGCTTCSKACSPGEKSGGTSVELPIEP